MGSMVPAISKALKLTGYGPVDVVTWLEIFMDYDLGTSEVNDTVTFIYEDIICALRVEDDGSIIEFVDITEDDLIEIDQDPDYIPFEGRVYKDFTAYRAAVKKDYPKEAAFYEKKLVSEFKKNIP